MVFLKFLNYDFTINIEISNNNHFDNMSDDNNFNESCDIKIFEDSYLDNAFIESPNDSDPETIKSTKSKKRNFMFQLAMDMRPKDR